MNSNKTPIKDAAERLSGRAKAASDDIKAKIPLYIEFLKTIARIGKNISLDSDRGLIKTREDFINDSLKDVSVEDKGLKSIEVSCKEGKASFVLELKKYLIEGKIEIPFTVESFIFSKEERSVVIKFGEKKVNYTKGFYSKIALWFVSSILSIFYRDEDVLKSNISNPDFISVDHKHLYTIDLNKISELKEIFDKGIANLKYWDLITIDKLLFEDGLVILRLSRKLAKTTKISIGIIKLLPVGRLITPLLNRF